MAIHRSGSHGKRKLPLEKDSQATTRKKLRSNPESTGKDAASEILLLENRILESRKNYNSIVTLLDQVNQKDDKNETSILAAVALCRIFCKLLILGALDKSKGTQENEAKISAWLGDRLADLVAKLVRLLEASDDIAQRTALTLLMRLFKHQAQIDASRGSVWHGEILSSLLNCVLISKDATSAREDFISQYLTKFHDLQYHTWSHVT